MGYSNISFFKCADTKISLESLSTTIYEARALLDLSGIWQFVLGNEEFDEEKMCGPLHNPETMAVPASFNDQKAEARFRDHYGFAYYQTNFQVPKTLLGQRLVLRFGAVTQSAHEHWNNSAEKMYSRNLGKEEGIELVRIYAKYWEFVNLSTKVRGKREWQLFFPALM